MTDSLGIWLVRLEAHALGIRLQQVLGGELVLGWQDSVTEQLSHLSVPEPIHMSLNFESGSAALESTSTQKERFAQAFRCHNQWVLVMATGIAVRFLDGLIADKHSDPAVVVLDEGGHHAISLLAGHEGGANALAYRVANAVSASPVVTTATEALKPLTIGLGCRKGTPLEKIEAAVSSALGERKLEEVRMVATIDIKQDEPGLLAFCARYGLPLRTFRRDDVAERPWVTKPSQWVRKNIGTDGVCEPCALMASSRGRLIVPKLTLNGVAVAIVEDDLRLD
jgi:cobalt-precorrin 5A hydrolase